MELHLSLNATPSLLLAWKGRDMAFNVAKCHVMHVGKNTF
jgi:hypothetical protein